MRLQTVFERGTWIPLFLFAFFGVLAIPTESRSVTPDVKCQLDQLKASAQRCQAELKCFSKYVKKPEKDPTLAKRDACLAKAAAKFEKTWQKALDRVVEWGVSCGLQDPAATAGNDFLAVPIGAFVDPDILNGWDPANPDDNKLRSTLLKRAGTMCKKAFSAEKKHAKAADVAKLAGARSKAREQFEKKADKAVVKATSSGVAYGGLPVPAARDEVDAIVDGLAPLTPPVQVTVSGTITGSPESFADGDVNDEASPQFNNDLFTTAQVIPVPSITGGYVNAKGEGSPGPTKGDGDPSDFFDVLATEGDVFTLHIARPNQADLDLCLYDETEVLIDCSMSASSAEAVTAPADGSYRLEVLIADGCDCSSNYVLTAETPATSTGLPGRRLSDEFVPGELIVTPAETGQGGAARARGMVALRAATGARAELWSVGGPSAQAPGIVARDRGADAERLRKIQTLQAAKALERDPEIAAVDLNYWRQALLEPNDLLYDQQWHYPLIGLPAAWDVTTGDTVGDDVIVAVIDTGILVQHPEFLGQTVQGFDMISSTLNSNDGDGVDADPDDPGDDFFGSSSFHGSHVAGTVAALSDNNAGVAGVAWGAKIMPIRVLGLFGGTDFDLIQAIRFAAGLNNAADALPQRRADIINMSLGGSGFSNSVQDAVQDARAEGVILIAAAGNSGSSSPSYPAAFDGVVSVSAVDAASAITGYSSFGGTIDVAAPGGDLGADLEPDGFPDGVLSTLGEESGEIILFVFDRYQGTSMAAPHVAGVAALMKAIAPDMTPDDFDAHLVSGALTNDLGDVGRDDFYGYGLIDAFKAVSAAGGTPIIGVLQASSTLVNLGPLLDSGSLTLSNVGEGSLTNVMATEDSGGWLTVTPDVVDADGLGTYTLAIDRTGLPLGGLEATVRFTSSANEVSVLVIASVGSADEPSSGAQYVLLINEITGYVMDRSILQPVSGSYAFEFTGVPVADYVLLSGTDHDGDGKICDKGDACGAYPDLFSVGPITLDANRDDLDFDTGFEWFLGAPGTGEPYAGSGTPTKVKQTPW